jgi:hypothetical protein
LLHAFFLKEEPTVASVVHKEMKRYAELSQNTYDSSLKLPLDGEFDMKKVSRELALILAEMVPQEWGLSFGAEASSELIIGQINDHLQNQIFLPTVEIESDLIKIRADASWLPAFK